MQPFFGGSVSKTEPFGVQSLKYDRLDDEIYNKTFIVYLTELVPNLQIKVLSLLHRHKVKPKLAEGLKSNNAGSSTHAHMKIRVTWICINGPSHSSTGQSICRHSKLTERKCFLHWAVSLLEFTKSCWLWAQFIRPWHWRLNPLKLIFGGFLTLKSWSCPPFFHLIRIIAVSECCPDKGKIHLRRREHFDAPKALQRILTCTCFADCTALHVRP